MKKLSLLMCLSLLSMMTFSQQNVAEFLKGGKEDGGKLIQAYLEPYAFALGDGLNNGWYNTADTHHLLGFDLTISASAIMIPDGSKSFDVNQLGLTHMKVNNGSSIAQTVAGSKTDGPKISVYDKNISDPTKTELLSFNSPKGTGLGIIPVPMVQLGFGLLPHTDIIGRYVPEMKYNNGDEEMKIGFWGAGIKHNFKEWIPFLKSLPFDASVFGSYSEVNGQSSLNYGTVGYTPKGDQFLKIKTQTSKVGLIVSKKLAILTVFAGIGESTSKSNVDLVGTYPISATVNGITVVNPVPNPIALDFQTSNLSVDAGFRIKLAILSLFGSVNHAKYTSYNAGLSLGFR